MAGHRKSMLTPARHKAIVAAIRAGETRTSAAARAGVGRRTLYDWLEAGDPPDTHAYPDNAYGRLAAAVARADAEYEADMITVVVAAAKSGKPGTWQAAMTILERRNPGDWGRLDRSKVELTGKDGGPLQVDVDMVAARDRLLSGIDRLASRGDQGDDDEGASGVPAVV